MTTFSDGHLQRMKNIVVKMFSNVVFESL